jgi:hypothetical protein
MSNDLSIKNRQIDHISYSRVTNRLSVIMIIDLVEEIR